MEKAQYAEESEAQRSSIYVRIIAQNRVWLLIGLLLSTLSGIALPAVLGGQIQISPDNLDFGEIEIGLSETQIVHLSGCDAWTAFTNDHGMDIVPSTGVGEGELKVKINTTTLGVGSYRFSVIVRTTEGCQAMPVELSVVQPSCGPIIVMESMIIDDPSLGGDGDGLIDAGERINFAVKLKSDGSTPAEGLYAKLSSDDPYVNITSSRQSYGEILPEASKWGDGDFSLVTHPRLGNGYTFDSRIMVKDDLGHVWATTMTLNVTSEFEPIPEVSPSWIDLGLVEKGLEIPLNLTISNKGDGILNWRVLEDLPWISVDPSLGILATGNGSVDLKLDTGPFTPGSYQEGHLNIICNGQDLLVRIVLRIGTGTSSPYMGLDTESLNFGEVRIGLTSNRTIKVFNAGGGMLYWSVIEKLPWLTAYPSAGIATKEIDIIRLMVHPETIEQGDHEATVFLRSSYQSVPIHVSFIALPANNPPVAVLEIDVEHAYINESVILDARKSYDIDGTIVFYMFDVGNEPASWTNSSVVCQIYEEAGNYSIGLRVKDDRGAVGSTHTILTVTRRTHEPIANLTVSSNRIKEGSTVNLSARGSHDPDGGSILNYNFAFGDGEYSSGTSPETNHNYRYPGQYRAKVFVTDDENQVGESEEILITVEQLVPQFSKPKIPALLYFRGDTSYIVSINVSNPSTAPKRLSLELIEEEISKTAPQENWSLGRKEIPNKADLVVEPNATRRIEFDITKTYSWIPPRNRTSLRIELINRWGSVTEQSLGSPTEDIWTTILGSPIPVYTSRSFRYGVNITGESEADFGGTTDLEIEIGPVSRGAFCASAISGLLSMSGSSLLPDGLWSTLFWMISDSLHAIANQEPLANVHVETSPESGDTSEITVAEEVVKILDSLQSSAPDPNESSCMGEPPPLEIMDLYESAAAQVVELTALVSRKMRDGDLTADHNPGLGKSARFLEGYGYGPNQTVYLDDAIRAEYVYLKDLPIDVLLGQLARKLANLSCCQMEEVITLNRIDGDNPIPPTVMNELSGSIRQLDLDYSTGETGIHVNKRIDSLKSAVRQLMINYTDPTLVKLYSQILSKELLLRYDGCPPHIQTSSLPENGTHIDIPIRVIFWGNDDTDPAPIISSNYGNGSLICEEREHVIWIRAKDHVGNTDKITRTFTLDNTAPDLMLMYNGSSLLITQRDANIHELRLSMNGSIVINVTEPPPVLAYPIHKKMGRWICVATARDLAGNSAERDLVVTVDEISTILLLLNLLLAPLSADKRICGGNISNTS